MSKEKLFGICHTNPLQKPLVEKYCFGSCGKIILGGLIDGGLSFLPCKEQKCPHEEMRLKYGKVREQLFWLRKLM